ncbi:hypothetical protein L9F63_007380, partial [Diploptera punctata]
FLVTVRTVELADPCASKQTCSACIQLNVCRWCTKPYWNNSKSRCSKKLEGCEDEFIINPKSSFKELVDQPLVSYQANLSKVVQLAPQEISLDLRINSPVNVTFRYSRAEYPIDLYYLMDLSNSMRDDKDTLSRLGQNLQELLLQYTSDLRLGFGSFVDKTVGPFTNPLSLQKPCTNCTSAYSFRNHLKLTSDLQKFSVEVERAKISGNIDPLEGGFDALMQTIVCHEEIGWRNNSRRLLVFSTDEGFHMAGDGRLAGIIDPNDGKCHMKNGVYTHSLLQDYPSVSQLNHKVRENPMNILFAVTDRQLQAYTYLSENIEGSRVGNLTSDSSNILKLVEEQYMKISSSVEMKDNAPKNIQVKYYTSCLNDDIVQSKKCDSLTIGQEVEFRVEVKVLSCPKNSADWNMNFSISPIGIHESSIVHVNLNCDCPCEHPDDPNYKINAEECSHNGTLMCGICSCNQMHFGKVCECESNDMTATSVLKSDCKQNPRDPDCSRRGVCICGICQCDARADKNEVISGKYCECDNYSCLRADGELCGGHGTCECGKCICEWGWKGDDCMCSTNEYQCMQIKEENVKCSNNGNCTCGKCECNDGYDGKFCEQSMSESLKTECNELLPCVLCAINETEVSSEECVKNCFDIHIELVDELEDTFGYNCIQLTEHYCRVEYQYNYENSSYFVKAVSAPACPTFFAQYYLIFVIILAILFLGLFSLFLWKKIVTIKDKREYSRFKKEVDGMELEEDVNPLFKPAKTSYNNPLYGRVPS